MRGQVRGRRLLSLLGRLGLAAPDQLLAAGADALLVQAGNHIRVDLPAQPEGGGAFPGPFAGWFPGRGVVRHRADTATMLLAGGEVGDVVTRVERPVSGHDP